MHRRELIRGQLQGSGTYLEIGVKGGATFWGVQADTKIAVDPHFVGRRLRVQLPLNRVKRAFGRRRGVLIYQETSNEFFDRDAAQLAPFDCVLVDGMHTAKQAHRDVMNALEHLAPDGLIVMHDCNPTSAAAASPTPPPDGRGVWSGDVWKAVMRLRTRDDLSVRVIDDDYGLGVVTRGQPEATLDMSDEQIDALTFDDLELHRVAFLNLTQPSH